MSNYIKNITTLSGGTLLSQIILILGVPIISRLYAPEDLGAAAVLIALASILSSLSTGKYDFAILLPKKENDSINILFGSILINITFCIFLLFIMLGFYWIEVEYINYNFTGYLLTISLIFFNGLNLSFVSWFNKIKNYKIISIGRILRNISLVFITIIFGIYFYDNDNKYIYIILSNIVGIFIFNLLLLLIFFKKYSKLFTLLSYKKSIQILKKHINFPKYSLPASVINIISSQSPIIILYILFGPVISGIYSLVNRVMGAPSQLIAISTGEVYRQKAAVLYDENGNCEKLFIKTFKGLFLISTVPFIIVILFGPDLFLFVFGEQWAESGYIARYLALFFMLRFSISPLSFTLIIGDRQDYNLAWQSFLFLNTTIGMIYGYLIGSYIISIISFSLIYSLMYIFYFIEIRKTSRGYYNQNIKNVSNNNANT